MFLHPGALRVRAQARLRESPKDYLLLPPQRVVSASSWSAIPTEPEPEHMHARAGIKVQEYRVVTCDEDVHRREEDSEGEGGG